MTENLDWPQNWLQEKNLLSSNWYSINLHMTWLFLSSFINLWQRVWVCFNTASLWVLLQHGLFLLLCVFTYFSLSIQQFLHLVCSTMLSSPFPEISVIDEKSKKVKSKASPHWQEQYSRPDLWRLWNCSCADCDANNRGAASSVHNTCDCQMCRHVVESEELLICEHLNCSFVKGHSQRINCSKPRAS